MPRGKRNRQLKQGLISAGRSGIANPIDIHVGMRIRLRRKVLKISQEELAEKLGITFQQVQKYERGKNRLTASRLFDISQVLQTPIKFFFAEINSDLANKSPRILAGLKPDELPDEATTMTDDILQSNETMEFVRNFNMIHKPETRQNVYDLIKMLEGKK